jgi:hypothetical protein
VADDRHAARAGLDRARIGDGAHALDDAQGSAERDDGDVGLGVGGDERQRSAGGGRERRGRAEQDGRGDESALQERAAGEHGNVITLRGRVEVRAGVPAHAARRV